jgi:hypothetical protein
METPNSMRLKKAREVKSKVVNIFFDIKGVVHHDWVKMCQDFALHSGDKRTGCCITTTHRLTLPFSPGNCLLKTT